MASQGKSFVLRDHTWKIVVASSKSTGMLQFFKIWVDMAKTSLDSEFISGRRF